MSNVLIINAHEPSRCSGDKLNAALVDKVRTKLESKGHDVRVVTTQDDIVVDEQRAHFEWADRVIVENDFARFEAYLDANF